MKTAITYIVAKKEFFSGILILISILGLMAFKVLTDKGETLYTVGAGSFIKISGTSNLQKWNLEATNFRADAAFILKDGEIEELQSLLVVLPVANVKGNENVLTTEAQKALKIIEHSNISFKLNNASVVPESKIIKASGNLTIAGVTKTINLVSYYIMGANESITCIAKQQINLSDYNIKAPTYVTGALKTDNVAKIDIILKMNKSILVSKN